MKPPPARSLTDVLKALVAEGARLQARFDAAHRNDCATAAQSYAHFRRVCGGDPPAGFEALVRQLLPRRLVLQHLELTLCLRLEAQRRVGFSLQAVPLNLGYALERRTRRAETTSLHVRLEQVPFPGLGRSAPPAGSPATHPKPLP